MKPEDLALLTNQDVPESVRAKIAEQIMGAEDRAAQRAFDLEKLDTEKRKFIWSTPLVAALAGLITLTATFVFDRITAQDATDNTITLEQVQNQLEQSEARLKQELELNTSVALARLEAEAREREFQFEIVRSELDKDGKTNAERASVLLFLARAGVLNALNAEELRAMAEEQKQNPDADIIPQLSSEGENDGFPSAVQSFSFVEANQMEREAYKLVFRLIDRQRPYHVFCNTIRLSANNFLAMSHCLEGFETFESLQLRKPVGLDRLYDGQKAQSYSVSRVESYEPAMQSLDGISTITSNEAGEDVDLMPTTKLKIREPVVGEKLFIIGYAPSPFTLSKKSSGSSLRMLPFIARMLFTRTVIQRSCMVLSVANGTVSTDCYSSRGMSGAPIFAQSDGALLTLAGWGDGDIGATAGPSLYLYSDILSSK